MTIEKGGSAELPPFSLVPSLRWCAISPEPVIA
jgi:hypothetical protein